MLTSLRTAAASASAAFIVSLCAGGAACAQTFHNEDGAIHFMYTPEYAKQIGRVPDANAGAMEYFGGTVFPRVEVVSVMWGKHVDSATIQGMPGFLRAIVNSTYVDQLGQYGTVNVQSVNGYKSSNQNLVRGTFLGQVIINPHNNATTLQDFDIHHELRRQIEEGNLPGNDTDTLYMVYFPNNITIEAFGLKSCINFGAYHFAKNWHQESALNIFYGVMPGCGYSFNSHTIVSSHEFAEATTDNIPTPGTNPDYPQAWNNSGGYEIGDLCEGTSGQLTTKKNTYYVQQEYLNSISGCSTGNYTSP